tara:strand:+ start:252 stop:662 length:411 start_codon:yes stop_codon:yes gene_type:complete
MAGETDLNTLLGTLVPKLNDGVFVFTTLSQSDIPQGLSPIMSFQEAEGTTLILLQSDAQSHNIDYEFPSRMITLDIHSSLEAVGFMAVIATALAKEDMGVNPVSGFYHDHLFVPDGRQDDAMRILTELAKSAGKKA